MSRIMFRHKGLEIMQEFDRPEMHSQEWSVWHEGKKVGLVRDYLNTNNHVDLMVTMTCQHEMKDFLSFPAAPGGSRLPSYGRSYEDRLLEMAELLVPKKPEPKVELVIRSAPEENTKDYQIRIGGEPKGYLYVRDLDSDDDILIATITSLIVAGSRPLADKLFMKDGYESPTDWARDTVLDKMKEWKLWK